MTITIRDQSTMTTSANKSKPVFGVRSALAVAVLMACATGAYAQSITGGLYGRELAGSAVTIHVANAATGYVKDLSVNSKGSYKLEALNPGKYTVTLQQQGKVLGSYTVAVTAGSNSAVPTMGTAISTTKAPAGANVQNLSTVTVSGAANSSATSPIDTSTTQLVSNYSKALINDLPLIDQSANSIALLSSAVQADRAGDGNISMGGASPAGNRNYYNGFDVTNDRTSLGAVALPTDAIASTQVMTSGATAQYTSALGGIISQTVRQGTNDFKAGYSVYYHPPTSRLLRPRRTNTYQNDGSIYQYNVNNVSGSQAQQWLWASGALIKNKLFFFALLGQSPASHSISYGSTKTVRSLKSHDITLNLTWDISDNQSLNVFGSHESTLDFANEYRMTVPYDPASAAKTTFSWINEPVETKALIANYHWQITNNLRLTLMDGYLAQTTATLNPSNVTQSPYPYVIYELPHSNNEINIGLGGTINVQSPVVYSQRSFSGRLVWQLGNHSIAAGIYDESNVLDSSSATPAAGAWIYYNYKPGVFPFTADSIVKSAAGDMRNINKAAYLEDNWQATDNLLLYAGWRFDRYVDQAAEAGVTSPTMFKLPHNSPRVGFSWDVYGDSSEKVGGNLGVYTIGMPTTFTESIGSTKFYTISYYKVYALDPTTNAPVLTGPDAAVMNPRVVVENDGTLPPFSELGATNLKAPQAVSAQLYFQKMLTPEWNATAELGYQRLERTIETTFDSDQITAYAQAHGYPKYVEKALSEVIFNPGSSVNLVRNFSGVPGQLQTLDIPASALGFRASEHHYDNLTLDLTHSHTEAQPWYLRLSYTFAREYGNSDGLENVEDNNGDIQAPIGDTKSFLYPEMQDGGFGNLAGDIRNSFAFTGAYYFGKHWTVSSSWHGHTGAPLSCIGSWQLQSASFPQVDATLASNQGNATHLCGLVISPQGGDGRLPFLWDLDLGVGYKRKLGKYDRIAVNFTVNNVTNRHGVSNKNEEFDSSHLLPNGPDGGIQETTYFGAVSYQAPRASYITLHYYFR